MGAPQDEVKLFVALRKILILRSPRSGRLEGRTGSEGIAVPRRRDVGSGVGGQ